jgi:hypothetical protein
VVIGTLGWVVVGIAAWLVVATVVGVVIGRVIRQRDRQVPRDAPGPADDGPGEAKPGPDHPSHASRRGTPRRR